MSRVIRNKINKVKSIKATITGLCLSLVIGLAGGAGSYAYFSAKAEAKNNLVIELGNLKTEVSKNIKVDGLKSTDKKTEKFEIENKGTLNQNINITFGNLVQNIDYSNYTNTEKINYELRITKPDGKTITKNSNIKDINNLSFSKDELGILESNEKFTCEAIITSNKIHVYEGGKISFDLNVDARQLGGDK